MGDGSSVEFTSVIENFDMDTEPKSRRVGEDGAERAERLEWDVVAMEVFR